MNTLRNRVQLIGHLGTDVEVKTIPNGAKVANMRIATTDRYLTNGEWKEDTQWHNLVMWERLAERAEQHLKKGAFLMVEGRLEHRSYKDKNGENRYFTEIKVSSFISLDKKNNGEEPAIMPNATQAEDMGDDGLPF